MKRLFLFPVVLFPAMLFLSGCYVNTPPRTSFTYELPSFSVALQGVDFEYVRYGAHARVLASDIHSKMAEVQSIGLVNEALRQIHQQIPTAQVQSGQYALVNVVTDVYNVQEIWVSRDMYGRVLGQDELNRGINVLSIRADVIKILPSQGNADAVGLAPSRGFYPWTEAGKELLVRDLIPALQNLSLSTSNSDIEIASHQKQFD